VNHSDKKPHIHLLLDSIRISMAEADDMDMSTDECGDRAITFFLLDICQLSPDGVQLIGRTPRSETSPSRSCCINVFDIKMKAYFIMRDGDSSPQVQAAVASEVLSTLTRHGISNASVKKDAMILTGIAVGGGGTIRAAVAEYPASCRSRLVASGAFGSCGEMRHCSRIIDPYETALEMVCIEMGFDKRTWLSANGRVASEQSAVTTCSIELSIRHSDLRNRLRTFDGHAMCDPSSVLTIVVATVAMRRNDASVIVEEREISQVGPAAGVPMNKAVSRRTWNPGDNKANIESRVIGIIGDSDPDIIVCHDIDPRLVSPAVRACGTAAWKLGRASRNVQRHADSVPAGWRALKGRMFLDTVTVVMENGTEKVRMARSLETQNILLAIDGELDIGRDTAEGEAERTAAIERALDGIQLPAMLSNITGLQLGAALSYPRHAHVERYLMRSFVEHGFVAPSLCSGSSPAAEAPTAGETKGTSSSNVRGKKHGTYEGGLVLPVEVGSHDDFTVLIDFKSLYPSIIAEYGFCTTLVKLATGGSIIETTCPSDGVKCGILPERVWHLVMERRTAAGSALRQKALKLISNAIYGCLAYKGSRFYAVGLAATITYCGRRALKDLAQISTEACDGARVIMGDTDSVFVTLPSASSPGDAQAMGEKIAAAANKGKRYMEATVQAVFDYVLVESKKRYMARGCGGDHGLVVKGLEMVKRDWCHLVWHACFSMVKAMVDVPDKAERKRHGREAALKAVTAFASNAREFAITGKGDGSIKIEDFVICRDVRRWWKASQNERGPWGSGGSKWKSASPATDSSPSSPYEAGGINAMVAKRLSAQCGGDRSRGVGGGHDDPQIVPPAGGFLGIIVGSGDSLSQAPMTEVARASCAVTWGFGSMRSIDGTAMPIPDIEYYMSTQVFPPLSRLADATGLCRSSDIAAAIGSSSKRNARSRISGESSSSVSIPRQDLDGCDEKFVVGIRCHDCGEVTLAIELASCSGVDLVCPRCGSKSGVAEISEALSRISMTILEEMKAERIACSNPSCPGPMVDGSVKASLKMGLESNCVAMGCHGMCRMACDVHHLCMCLVRQRKIIEGKIPLWDLMASGVHCKLTPPPESGGTKRWLCSEMMKIENGLFS
jgi:DNA polymerase elongation subunit (family B)